MSAVTLNRTTFRTSRLLDFASEKELVAQIGHAKEAWPVVILKELVDNAIDACEEAGIAPVVAVTLARNRISIEDNGPGVPCDVIQDVLDFSVRVSSREAYVSPTRGAQGNALKTIVAIPFVLDGHAGRTVIETRGQRHRIDLGVDRIRQQPTVEHRVEPGDVDVGTRVTVEWPEADSPRSILRAATPQFLQLAASYPWLNPHLTLAVDGSALEGPDRVWRSEATDPAWSKWKPSDPTSVHWYTAADFERLVAAYIAHDHDRGQMRSVRELVTEFRGLSGSAKGRAILEETGLARAPLTTLANGRDLDHAKVAALLEAMQRHSKPVKPETLGIIGRAHFEARFAAYGAEPESFDYRVVKDTLDGVPSVLEAAFVWLPQLRDRRMLVSGINWSPGMLNPFRELGPFGTSLDTILTEQRAGQNEPIILVTHLASARVEYMDRGKSAVATSEARAAKIVGAIQAITKKWAKQRKAEERHAAAVANRRTVMTRRRTTSIRAAAFGVMESAYRKVSDNGELPALARQIMYAARPTIQRDVAPRELGDKFDKYFTQGLLPDFVAAYPQITAEWNVVFDARGSFIEPHTENRVQLGTLNVRAYLAEIRDHAVEQQDFDIWERHYPTIGPANRFGAILFVEKEGFDPLFEAVKLAQRHDLAIMSTKGMSVTASRELVEYVCGLGVPLLVLHDFDKSGFSIVGTLRRSTRRYRFGRGHASRVIDLGLRLEDVAGLETEDVYLRPSAAANLRQNGATPEEIAFLLERRVELNAFTSRGLIDWLKRKLEAHGIKKVVPDADTLADAYQRMRGHALVQDRINAVLSELGGDAAPVPRALAARIARWLNKNPALAWDAALREIAEADHNAMREETP